VRFSEIVGRLNGFSTPIFGVSWTPPVSDVAVARALVAFVEDRRVLFADWNFEVPADCVQSVMDIRKYLVGVVGNSGVADQLRDPSRIMTGYCRRFLDSVGLSEDRRDLDAATRRLFEEERNWMSDFRFAQALGELRAGVALQVAVVAAAYGLDVEDDLARTLPPLED
jgi:hypothetical protein